MTTATTEISASDFVRRDIVSMVRVLKVVQKAGPEGIMTRKLCEKALHSKSYGLRIITRAEKKGYITRTGTHHEKGGGTKRICRLTEKGKLFLEQLATS